MKWYKLFYNKLSFSSNKLARFCPYRIVADVFLFYEKKKKRNEGMLEIMLMLLRRRY